MARDELGDGRDGLDLEVEKNVVLSFDRTYLWEIDKEADETTVTVEFVE